MPCDARPYLYGVEASKPGNPAFLIVLYLTFGTDLRVHQQAAFSVMTLLGRGVAEVQIWTDAPHFYRFFGERIVTKSLSHALLADWKGPHDFFWRIKIAALRQIAADNPGKHVLYLDADTFAFSGLSAIEDTLAQGRHLMHALEGRPSELPTSTERRMGRQTEGKSFGPVTVTAEHRMYNAGVVAVSALRARPALAMALEICDAMCAAGVTRRLVEQFSLSIALKENGGLRAANDVIGHYWGNKLEWTQHIGQLLLEHHLRGSSLEQQIDSTLTLDFRNFPVYRKSSSTGRKVTDWITRKAERLPHAFVPLPDDPPDERSERWRAR